MGCCDETAPLFIKKAAAPFETAARLTGLGVSRMTLSF